MALIQAGKIVSAGPVAGLLGGESQQCELLFRGIGIDLVKQKFPSLMDVRALPNEIRALCEPGEKLNHVLRALVEARAEIVAVVPIRPSLENYFT